MSEFLEASGDEIRSLVGRLADYSTRGRAKRRLVLIGAPAVPELVRALSAPVEGLAWSAARTLGDIGDRSAVEGLLGVLGSPAAGDAALESLRRITGRDLGNSPDAWRKALTGAPAEASAEAPGPDGDGALAASLVSENVSMDKTSSGYSFVVRLQDGRRQKVDMLLGLKDAAGEPLVAFYTECGPASPNQYEWALKTNLRLPCGAIALRETASGPRFVMVESYLKSEVTRRQLAGALDSLASRADAFERSLTGRDVS